LTAALTFVRRFNETESCCQKGTRTTRTGSSDGEPDRHVDDVFDWFALAFWSDEKLAKASERETSTLPAPDFKYRVLAEVIYLSDRACIIDFGLKATSTDDLLPARCHKLDFVTGEIGLRLPLVTEVGPEKEFRKLAYRWRVNRISADLTPYILHPDNPRFFTRDNSRTQYLDVLSTDSAKASDYILHCIETPQPH
jgi:hypothetical protein